MSTHVGRMSSKSLAQNVVDRHPQGITVQNTIGK
jgi:hypothetical protein